MLDKFNPIICKLAGLESLTKFDGSPPPNSIHLPVGNYDLYILNQNVNISKERARLTKELDYTRGFLESVRKKLGNVKFMLNAKPDLVDKERKKERDALNTISTLEASLADLSKNDTSSFITTEEILKAWGIENYTIDKDGSVDVKGDVDISDKGLKGKISDYVTFGVVSGRFNCSYNKLDSLEGAPKEVGKSFNCSNNQLISLKYIPKNLCGGVLDCSFNTKYFTEEDVKEFTMAVLIYTSAYSENQ